MAIKIIVGYYKTNSYIYKIRSNGRERERREREGKFIENGITCHGDIMYNKMY
jgi:hypothetical protein